ncbi:MAG: hypothetical protein ACR2H3_12870 [Acidimicrobiales bacterium]
MAIDPVESTLMSGWRRLRVALAAALLATTAFAGLAASPASAATAYPLGPGYWTAASDGGIFSFGDAQFMGSTGAINLNSPVIGMAAHPFLEGYWLAATDGGIFSFGSSGFYGSTGNIKLAAPVSGMASHPSGAGYWLAATDGGVFSFGAAKFKGSMGGITLNKPVVGIAANPSGEGYWLVASDGGVFAFGDAVNQGSLGNKVLNEPIVGMAATPTGLGYWLVAADGGVFAFGDAGYFGSTGNITLNKPVVGIAASNSGNGYRMVATDGGVFNYGDAAFFGSTGNIALNKPMLGIATRPRLAVAADPFDDDANSTSLWDTSGPDAVLRLTNTASDSVPAGARILGVEGLILSQLGTVSIALDAGTCGAGPSMLLYLDTTGDDSGDTTTTLTCGQLTAGVDPVAASGKPGSSKVLGADLIYNSVGTVSVDDIGIAGLVITDHNPAR